MLTQIKSFNQLIQLKIVQIVGCPSLALAAVLNNDDNNHRTDSVDLSRRLTAN